MTEDDLFEDVKYWKGRADAAENAIRLLEEAEEFHANCDECNGEDIPELCEKCFPLYDDARQARRQVLADVSEGKES